MSSDLVPRTTKRALLRTCVFSAMALSAAGILALHTLPADAQVAWIFRAPKDFAEINQVIAEKFPSVPFLTVGDIAAAQGKADTPVLLDYRAKAEYEVSHLAGAIWVADLSAARAAIAKVRVSDPKRKVVVYCSVGYRSADLVNQLMNLPDRGYSKELYNLRGSIFQWANEGLPLVKLQVGVEVPATQVHPYNSKWGALLQPQLRYGG